MLEQSLQSETLAPEELVEITGCFRHAGQIVWLHKNEWKYHKNSAGAPIVGRWYARMNLAGITPRADNAEAWAPNFATIK